MGCYSQTSLLFSLTTWQRLSSKTLPIQRDLLRLMLNNYRWRGRSKSKRLDWLRKTRDCRTRLTNNKL